MKGYHDVNHLARLGRIPEDSSARALRLRLEVFPSDSVTVAALAARLGA